MSKIKPKKPKKGNWTVRMKCESYVDFYVENCTEEEARNNTFAHSVDEQLVEYIDWEPISVKGSQ